MKSYTLAVAILAVGLTVPAFAGPSDDILQAMSKCSTVADNTARLACYDALKPQLDAALQAPPPPPVATVAPPEERFGMDHKYAGGTSDKPQTKPEEFGSERLPQQDQAKIYPPAPGQPEEIDTISGTLTDYALNPFGRFTVFLDNGQIWQQTDSDTAHFHRNPKENTVTISRALFGSYSLQLNGANKAFKVKRIK